MPTIWPEVFVETHVRISSRCSKRLSSKAAASEGARRTLRYVELLSDARTPLADFFSILLKKVCPLRDIVSVESIQGDHVPAGFI